MSNVIDYSSWILSELGMRSVRLVFSRDRGDYRGNCDRKLHQPSLFSQIVSVFQNFRGLNKEISISTLRTDRRFNSHRSLCSPILDQTCQDAFLSPFHPFLPRISLDRIVFGRRKSRIQSMIGSRSIADHMWQLNMRGDEAIERGPYPERRGEPDCSYYIRTGLCKFGLTCRFNHPPNRMLAGVAARFRGVFPERIGQPECQYYLKTGTCKFGATCKFHHPKDKGADSVMTPLNVLGYPLRPSEKECAYYLRTGLCKFGSTCKFHHPPPSSTIVSLRGSSVYPTGIPGQHSFSGGLTNWSLSRASFLTSPSSFPQLILPQGMVQVPGWNPYPGQVGSSVSSPGNQQTTPARTGQLFGSAQQSDTAGQLSQGSTSSYPVNSIPMGIYAFQKENTFPERPGEPECQYYMKTGDCKFGAVCRFHHPRERIIPVPDCILSPLGLPLRPGETPCLFYLRYGICKFGSHCKFDHPMGGAFAYGIPSSSSIDHSSRGQSIGHLPSGTQPLLAEGLEGASGNSVSSLS